MQSHEAQTVFPDDPELASKATVGEVIKNEIIMLVNIDMFCHSGLFS